AGGAAAAAAAASERRKYINDVLGEDVSSAVIAKSADADGALCQRAIAKAADRLLAAYITSFTDCVNERIDAGTVFAPESLEACLDYVAGNASSAGSHIALDAARLAQAREKNCAATSLSAAFPGPCGSEAGTSFDACLAMRAACRSCLDVDAADD